MAKSRFALVVTICCLLSASEAYGQSQRNNQRSFTTQRAGRQNTSAFGGQRGASAFGQQRGGQQQLGRGSQFGTAPTGRGGFVGSDAQDMRRGFQNVAGGQRRGAMFDMMVENLNEMRNSRRQRNNRRKQSDSVRVQLRPTFSYPQLDSRQVAVTLQSSLARSSDITGIVAPRIELVGRTATVSGFVPSEHERAVIERMIALQPGVSKVENLLTVDPFAPATEPAAEEGSPEASSAEPAAESSVE